MAVRRRACRLRGWLGCCRRPRRSRSRIIFSPSKSHLSRPPAAPPSSCRSPRLSDHEAATIGQLVAWRNATARAQSENRRIVLHLLRTATAKVMVAPPSLSMLFAWQRFRRSSARLDSGTLVVKASHQLRARSMTHHVGSMEGPSAGEARHAQPLDGRKRFRILTTSMGPK